MLQVPPGKRPLSSKGSAQCLLKELGHLPSKGRGEPSLRELGSQENYSIGLPGNRKRLMS